ncbi:MAG: sugar transferase [Bacteroidota bacterium]
MKLKYPLYKYIFAMSDWLTMFLAFVLAYRIASMWEVPTMVSGLSPFAAVAVVALCSLGVVSVFHYFNLYKLNVIVTVAGHALRLVLATIIVVLGFALAVFFFDSHHGIDHRITVTAFAGIAFGGSLILRVVVLRNLFMLLARYRIMRRRVVIVGAGETGRKLAVTLFLNKHIGLDVVGFLDDEIPVGTPIFRGARILGRTSDIDATVNTSDIEEILITVENTDHPTFVALIEKCALTNAVVKICSPLYEIIPSRLFIEHYGDMPVVAVSQSTPSSTNETYKRVFDLVLASIAILFLSPLLIFIAVLIKWDSPGSVLYRQTRIGRGGRPFTFYKFRSMRVGSDQDENRKKLITEMIKQGSAVELMEKGTTKIVNKAQVTRSGKLLRRTSLDELPQLFNVLKGDMSLVGPRPCLPYEWENYEEWHKKRLSVSPGCTGVWQVSGRSEVGFRDMVILDLYYIQNASLNLDFKLLLKTIPVMLFGKGGG